MGFGGAPQYIPAPLPWDYKQPRTVNPKEEEGFVVKERALEGFEKTYSSNQDNIRNKLKHEQVFSTDSKENFGLFDDGTIRPDASENLKKYTQKDPNVYAKEDVDSNIKTWNKEKASMDYMYDYIKDHAAVGEEMPFSLPDYNLGG